MKKLILGLLASLCCFTAFSQAPQGINYQAVARNSAGGLLSKTSISLRISILDKSTTGSSVYSETHSVTTNILGLFTIVIGKGSVVSGDFSKVDWGNGDKFLKVEMDSSGGSSFKLMGTSQLLSVPYALYAAKSGDSNSYKAGSGITIKGDTINSTNIGTTNYYYASSVGQSFLYPDGIDSIEPITIDSTTTTYTVPASKNFYITTIQLYNNITFKVDNDTISTTSFQYGAYTRPLIIGGNQKLTLSINPSSKGSHRLYVNGFLVKAYITPVIQILNTKTYTVPTGKTLIILSEVISQPASGIAIDGTIVGYGMNGGAPPYFAAAGQKITMSNGVGGFFGYLK